jgi:hypothetical protein
LDAQLPDIGVKTQVSPQIESVLCIVNVGIAQLGKLSLYPDCDVIADLFSVKKSEYRLGRIEMVIRVEIAKVLGNAAQYAEFSLIYITVLLLRAGTENKTQYCQPDQKKLLHTRKINDNPIPVP